MIKTSVTVLASLLWVPFTALGLEDYKGCKFEESHFTVDTLMDVNSHPETENPIQMDFDPITLDNGKVDADLYWIERFGKIKRMKAGTRSVETLGFIEANNTFDYGLLGMALDPNFKTNRWIYFWYAAPEKWPTTESISKIGNELRLSRITLKGDKLDMSSEKIIYKAVSNVYTFEVKGNIWHAGGPMKFDRHGNLYFTIGNNSTDCCTALLSETDSLRSDLWGAGSSKGARGSIHKIKPIGFPDSESPATGQGSTYEIPAGNFGEFYAEYWKSKGDMALSQEYLDTTKVNPTIYVFGFRSIFSVNVDPASDHVAWGEINNGHYDEWNIVKKPAWSGYPFFSGYKNSKGDLVKNGSHKNTAEKTILTEGQLKMTSGVKTYPPMLMPTVPYDATYDAVWKPANLIKQDGIIRTDGASAMAGPVYRYNGALKSDRKWPPHFDGKWLIMDFDNRSKWVVTIDTTGDEIKYVNSEYIFDEHMANWDQEKGNWPIDLEFGPDGAMYIVDYGTRSSKGNHPGTGRIVRFSYNQTCQDPNLNSTSITFHRLRGVGARLAGSALSVSQTGFHQLKIMTPSGKVVFQVGSQGPSDYRLNKLVPGSGVYIMTLGTEAGRISRKLVL